MDFFVFFLPIAGIIIAIPSRKFPMEDQSPNGSLNTTASSESTEKVHCKYLIVNFK